MGNVSGPHWVEWDRLQTDVWADPTYGMIIDALNRGDLIKQPYVLIETVVGVLYFKNRLGIMTSRGGSPSYLRSSVRPHLGVTLECFVQSGGHERILAWYVV